jgi:hypothetical protein
MRVDLNAATFHASLVSVAMDERANWFSALEDAEMWFVAACCLHWYQRPLRHLLLSMPHGVRLIKVEA